MAYGDTNEVTNRGFVYRFTLDTVWAEPVAITSEGAQQQLCPGPEQLKSAMLYWNSFYYFDFYGFFQLIYAELYESTRPPVKW